MSRVFICYSREDSAFADRLVADLKAAGVPTWRDVDDIPGDVAANTQSWRRAVNAALRECTHMIVVLSPDAVDSIEVEAEWNHFLSFRRPVYPILHCNCEVPYRLHALQLWDARDDYEGMLSRLVGLLAREPVIPTGPAATPTLPDVLTVDVLKEPAAVRDILATGVSETQPAAGQEVLAPPEVRAETTRTEAAEQAQGAALPDQPEIGDLMILMPIGGMVIGCAISVAAASAVGGELTVGTFLAASIGWAVSGAIGGLVAALTLRRAEPSVQWKQGLITILGWAIGGGTGWAIGGPIVGAIGGAIGSGVMFWQINWARRRAAGSQRGQGA